MKNQSNYLLLVLFALTVGIVGWLGNKLANQQDQQIKLAQINRSQQTLLLMQNNINQYLQTQMQKMDYIASLNVYELEYQIKTNPLIHAILIFNQQNQLQFPDETSIEKQNYGYRWLRSRAITTEDNSSNKNIGWFIWHDQQKEKFIFWVKKPFGTIFIELNNSMFMAEFIHWLADLPNISDQGYLKINDNEARIFYQWGNSEIGIKANADIYIQKNLNAPLVGWSLHYYSNNPSLSAFSKNLFLIMLIGAMVLLALITFILFRMKRREQIEAQQQLSFINQVSHELKTPLTNIRLHGDLLERIIPDSYGNSLDSIKIIQTESKRLTRLINNVLNFNSIGKQKLKLHYSKIQFNQLMHKALLPFKPAFKQLNINFDFVDNIKQEVTIDIDIYTQILGNLLSNIEKYAADSKEVRIVADVNSESSTIIIIIQDQGTGIANKFKTKIFKPFYRIHNNLTTATGSGLGLGLARELARLHGGDLVLIYCKKGACFKLTLKENHA